eukprot:CAMPEP_0171059874 /NCGR_PEP_ID=MMETSP0766_2-20121228/3470_1 /TAXON_ID=439317 /ORGANISM="Gambierdiscus australes, Strain CAWD 149" /LENGTH=48 /DNA_ID= /DNA_START= /DNA_END= /DNA_ORIENTATION=
MRWMARVARGPDMPRSNAAVLRSASSSSALASQRGPNATDNPSSASLM